MLTEKENKIITNIVSGKMQRIKLYLIVLNLGILIPFGVIGHLYVQRQFLKVNDELYDPYIAKINKIETHSKGEVYLKSMVLNDTKQIKELNSNFIKNGITWRMVWFITILSLPCLSLWGQRRLENIIKELKGAENKGVGGV
jgi:hypothetical protein